MKGWQKAVVAGIVWVVVPGSLIATAVYGAYRLGKHLKKKREEQEKEKQHGNDAG